MSDYHLTTLANGWTVGRFAALDEIAWLAHAVTTKQSLDVQLARNDHAAAARQLAETLGLGGVAFVNQVHGGVVLRVDSPFALRSSPFDSALGDADGLVAADAGLGLMTRGADCPLILAVDPVAKVVGTAHASWRGTVCRIAEELVRQMQAKGAAPERVIACVCPSAGPCCYEVGQDVLEEMTAKVGPHAKQFFVVENIAMHLDLWAANRDQLVRSGLREWNVYVSGICTMCNTEMYPSHRREGVSAGRLAAVIGRTQ